MNSSRLAGTLLFLVAVASATIAMAQTQRPQGQPSAPAAKGGNCPVFVPARLERPFNVERAYPQRAIEREIEGHVTYRASIDETGRVSEVTIVASEPPGVFDAAVVREVQRTRFLPAQRRCQPVPDEVEATVTFELD